MSGTKSCPTILLSSVDKIAWNFPFLSTHRVVSHEINQQQNHKTRTEQALQGGGGMIY